MPVATAGLPWSNYCMFHYLCWFVSGSHSRRTRTACLQMRWPSYLHPAYCAVPTPLTRYRASATSARPLRKMLYTTFTSILFYISVKELNTVQSSYSWNGYLACSILSEMSKLSFLFDIYLLRCVELIICEQMRKYKARLKDINTLEFAESKAKSRLTHIRRSMVSDSTPQSSRLTQDLHPMLPHPWPSAVLSPCLFCDTPLSMHMVHTSAMKFRGIGLTFIYLSIF